MTYGPYGKIAAFSMTPNNDQYERMLGGTFPEIGRQERREIPEPGSRGSGAAGSDDYVCIRVDGARHRARFAPGIH